MFFLAFLNTIKIILENSILKYGLDVEEKGNFPDEAMEQNGAKN